MSTTIQFKNLASTTTASELCSLLSTCGAVRSVILADAYSGMAYGTAQVEMASVAAVLLALRTLNGRMFKGKELRMELHHRPVSGAGRARQAYTMADQASSM